MAGQKQPIELLVLKGKKHLTKKEIQDRRDSQVKVSNKKVHAPSYLSPDLKKEFNKIAKELMAVELITNLDVDTLVRFVIARKMYIEISNKLLETDVTSEEFLKLLQYQDKLFKQCRSTSQDLGLTISSRCKLVIPKKEKEKPSEFENKFGDV